MVNIMNSSMIEVDEVGCNRSYASVIIGFQRAYIGTKYGCDLHELLGSYFPFNVRTVEMEYVEKVISGTWEPLSADQRACLECLIFEPQKVDDSVGKLSW